MRPLVAGDVSARTAYRWLRRLPRDRDVYFAAVWEPACWPVDLPDATDEALTRMDLRCKTLDDATPGRWMVRSRCWYGRASLRTAPGPSDRSEGTEIARRVAAVLRAAHRDGVALRVEAA